MTTFLLDATVLIALSVAEHEHFDRAQTWAAGVDRFAVCPIVEGGLVRFLVRVGERATAAQEVLRRLRTVRGFEFWTDDLPLTEADVTAVTGHRQVTDAYLVSLAASRPGSRLATLDRRLSTTWPAQTLLLPEPR